jgi:hypothetical protein
MNKHFIAVIGVATVCVLLGLASNVFAEDVNQPKDVPIDPNKQAPKETPKEPPRESPKESTGDIRLVIGIVNVEKDKDGNVTEIMLTAHKDLIYKVVPDEKGKELAAAMVDKRARVEGFIETKDNVHWLTVQTFGESKATSGAKTKVKPAKKPAPKSKK